MKRPVLHYHMCLGLPSNLFLAGILPKPAYLSSLHACYMNIHLQLHRFDHPSNIWRRVQATKSLLSNFALSSLVYFPYSSLRLPPTLETEHLVKEPT
jgi:hypothetical protein